MLQNGFATPSDLDHRGWLWVVTILAIAYSLLCAGARIICKWGLLWYDDAMMGVAYLFALIHWGLLAGSLTNGAGTHHQVYSMEDLEEASLLYFVARIFYFGALTLTKVSVLMFIRRIFSRNMNYESFIFNAAYAVIGTYGLAAVLLSSAGCDPSQTLNVGTDAVCHANVARWSVITALDASSELALFFIPTYLISLNQLKKSKKAVVVFVFSFRLLDCALGISQTVLYTLFLRMDSERANVGIAPTIALQEIHLGVALISASVPCLRTFLWAFVSGGLKTILGGSTHMDSQSGSGNNHNNSHITHATRNNRGTPAHAVYDPHYSGTIAPHNDNRPAIPASDWLGYKVDVQGGRMPTSSNDHSSMEDEKSTLAAHHGGSSYKKKRSMPSIRRHSSGSDEDIRSADLPPSMHSRQKDDPMIIHRNVVFEIERS